jgi:chemotaxis protein methyltransferase CheR
VQGPLDVLAPATLGDDDFAYLRGLVRAASGIHLSEGKRAFLAGRLTRRLRALGLATYAEYTRHVRASGDGELAALLDALCTHETRFFREASHFDFLAHRVARGWREAEARRGPRRRRIWCAGCSTGEEAYSLAMTLCHASATDGAGVEILATDLSTKAIETARDGVYPLARADEIPEALRKAFMLRGRGRWEGRMRAGAEIRALVRFERHNLDETPYPIEGRFDVIFCRNVLIYFDAATRARVAGALLARLAHGGLLFVGHAEGLQTAAVPARAVAPSVYAAPGASREGP